MDKEFDELMDKIKKSSDLIWIYGNKITMSDCLHDNCPECHGTGNKDNGGICVHFISCSCSKCTPTY